MIRNSELDPEQRHAVERILCSRDFVTLFRGRAGSGKSYTLGEVYSALDQAGHMVEVVVPQRQQVMDLEKDRFRGARTVSAFLARGKLPRGGVVVVTDTLPTARRGGARNRRAGDSIHDFLAGFPTVKRSQVISFLEQAKDRLVATVSR